MPKFERVNRFLNDETIHLPIRKTVFSAGYDFEVAEDTIIPSYHKLMEQFKSKIGYINNPVHIAELKNIVKQTKIKPTLVPTGIKCKLDANQYLELTVRSSLPLKYWLILANSEGIIDSDYYNNSDNDGEIYFQLINLSPYDLFIPKGEAIGQGIIKTYNLVEDDLATGMRLGGFGSTDA